MKKIILLSMVLLPTFGLAQFNKGQVFLGGAISASSSNESEPATPTIGGYSIKNNLVSLLPMVGIFLNEKIAVGGGVGYTSSFSEYNFTNSIQKYSNMGVNVSAFTRYYFPLSSTFYFVADGQVSFIRANKKNSYNSGTQVTSSENPNYTLGITLSPTFIFFPSQRWGIEAGIGSIGYQYQRDLPNASSGNSFNIGFGGFSFGLAYYFAKK